MIADKSAPARGFSVRLRCASQPPITKETAGDGPLALIMAPTRELVQQIEDETRKFAGELKIRVYSVVGRSWGALGKVLDGLGAVLAGLGPG